MSHRKVDGTSSVNREKLVLNGNIRVRRYRPVTDLGCKKLKIIYNINYANDGKLSTVILNSPKLWCQMLVDFVLSDVVCVKCLSLIHI